MTAGGNTRRARKWPRDSSRSIRPVTLDASQASASAMRLTLGTMARAAGVDALAVTYGAHAAEGLRACAPLACFSSVKELNEWLKTHA